MATKTPRTPYEKLGGLVYFGRTIDKIRYKAEGTLRSDFFALMGKGFDGRLMSFLCLDYAAFAQFVLSGATDEQCVEYITKHGRKLTEDDVVIWNDFATKRGWKDSASQRLEEFKAESNLVGRNDLLTIFEYMEVDEGRRP